MQGEASEGVKEYVESRGLAQISDPAQIGEMLDSIIQAHPKELEQFRSGKTKIQGYFSGYCSCPSSSHHGCALIGVLNQQGDRHQSKS